MEVRKATEKDSEGIALVLKESYNIDTVEEGKEVFSMELKKGMNYIVADDNGKIIGLTTWIMHGLPKHGLVELDRIAVLPEFRGKGIGKKLFSFTIDELEKNIDPQEIFLSVSQYNIPALIFYLKNGFVIFDFKKKIFDNLDRLYLRLETN